MPLRPDDFSRFKFTGTTLQEGQEVWGLWNRPSVLIRELREDEYDNYVVPNNREGRPDRIAGEFYGASELDWVLIAYNNATDVFNWPRIGDVIQIPKSGVVVNELL